jgi:hypothetical protein
MSINDCTDIKALLSALVDGELDADTQHAAERHLAECRACRTLVDQAESLNELIRLESDSTGGDALPDGFARSVLQRTATPRRSHLHEWTNWAGWLAAAAALALAVAIWSADRGRAMGPALPAAPDASSVMPATYREAHGLQSLAFDGALPAQELSPPTRLTREDAEALYFASILLREVAASDAEDYSGIRRAAEYEGLLDALAEVQERLDPNDRAVVLAAHALLHSVVRGGSMPEELRDLRRATSGLDLSSTIRAISDRRLDPEWL